MAIERRVTELAGPVGGQAAHRALAQRPGRDRRGAVHARRRAGAAATGIERAHARARRRAERHLDWPMPGYTHLQRAQPVYLVAPPARVRLDARPRPRALPLRRRGRRRRCRSARARSPGVNFDDRPRHGRRRARLRRGVGAELDRRRLQPRLRPRLPQRRRDLRDAPLAPRRGDRAVVERGVRVRRAAATRGRPARRSCRRRRTPTRPSCCARRRRGSPATCSALHGVMHALPLTYNKDMQEDKEHLFDAVDTLELCLAAAPGHARRRRRFHRERMADAASDELIAATDIADLLVQQGRAVPRGRTASSPASCGVAVDSGRPLSELTPEELREASAELDDASSPRCSTQQSWLESKVSRAGPRCAACASSSTSPAGRSRRSGVTAAGHARWRLLRPAGARRRARPRRLHVRARGRPAA